MTRPAEPEVLCECCGVLDSGKFCSQCRAVLPWVCPCGAVSPTSARFCARCGDRCPEHVVAEAGAEANVVTGRDATVDVDQSCAAPRGQTSADVVAMRGSKVSIDQSVHHGPRESEEERLVKLREVAEQLLRDRRFSRAQRVAEDILELDAEYGAAHAVLARVAQRQGRWLDAARSWSHLVAQGGIPEEYTDEIAQLARGLADPEDAKPLFSMVPHPALASALFAKIAACSGSIATRVHSMREVWAALESASPGLGSPVREECGSLIRALVGSAGSPAETIAALDFLHEIVEGDVSTWRDLGDAHSEAEDVANALRCYERALSFAQDDVWRAWLWNSIGLVFCDQGDYERALDAFAQALSARREDPVYWRNAAFALSNLGRHEEALEHCDGALQLEPEDPRTVNLKGDQLDSLGRLDEALECYRRSAASDDTSAPFASDLARALRTAGRLDEAFDASKRAITLRPDLAEAWSAHGLVLAAQGNEVRARTAFAQSFERNPDQDWVEFGYALGLLETDLEWVVTYAYNTIALCRIEVDQEWAGSRALRGFAGQLCDAGEYERAIEPLQDSLREYHSTDAYELLSRAMRGVGRTAEAVDALQRGLGQFPETPSLLVELFWANRSLGDHEAALGAEQRLREVAEWRWKRLQAEIVAREEAETTDGSAAADGVGDPGGRGPGKTDEDLEEADIYLGHGMLDEAEYIYERVLERVPDHSTALLRLEEIAAERGEAPREPSATPGSVDHEQLLAEASVYVRYGKTARAAGALKQILRDDPNHRAARLKLNECWEDLGLVDLIEEPPPECDAEPDEPVDALLGEGWIADIDAGVSIHSDDDDQWS